MAGAFQGRQVQPRNDLPRLQVSRRSRSPSELDSFVDILVASMDKGK
jgi:hypothetical protein